MNIRIIAVGRLTEPFFKYGLYYYIERLKKYCVLSIIEIKDESMPENFSALQRKAALEKEGARILELISPTDYTIALAIDGDLIRKNFSSLLSEHTAITFIIGGSVGLPDSVLKRANKKISLSGLTFPHRLTRLILLEALYLATH
ncbi:MAG: 23S rRNA (pseudouridine(1915)-N(3))-methyltransferase RlmH [Clostridiales bacterium]|jgi:23S rRNA (pseudouridine1915-N3)-methyltransferase|nr:23S rRNA (pseudouridine(1915)-N(3))-methyltransferase RlmH [Clostridiales bacterium]